VMTEATDRFGFRYLSARNNGKLTPHQPPTANN